MLKTADIVVITKGDIVSQAEREVFSFKVCQVNPRARIIGMNGITGQGSMYLARTLEESAEPASFEDMNLRFTMPGALCSYCLGERRVGTDKQIGVARLIDFRD
jgi:F420-0:gamma-glutamyl ligase